MKALAVDDNIINLKLVEKTLEKMEVDVDTVKSGKECLEKVKNNDYFIIFMDIMMPEMSGDKALLKLKENPNFNTPVIALTADVTENSKENYLNMGFSEYIAKPFKLDEIKEVVEKYI